MSRVLIYCLLCAFSTSLVQAGTIKGATTVFKELIETLNNLHSMIQTDADELHSPRNILDTCHLSALNCFKNQTLLLRPLQDHNTTFNLSISRIRYSHLPIPGASDLKCPPCTSYKKQSPGTFVNDFRALLQQLYRTYNMDAK